MPLATSPPAANGVNGQSNGHATGGAEEESVELFEKDHSMYLEERYGRNLNMTSASSAKIALRRRVAGLLVSDGAKDNAEKEVEAKESLRGVAVTEGDVYLYPTGMAAIWTAHQLILKAIGERKSVCFGWVSPLDYAYLWEYCAEAIVYAAFHTPTRSRSWRNGVQAAISSATAPTTLSTSLSPFYPPNALSTLPHHPSSPSSLSSRPTRSCAPPTYPDCGSWRTNMIS